MIVVNFIVQFNKGARWSFVLGVFQCDNEKLFVKIVPELSIFWNGIRNVGEKYLNLFFFWFAISAFHWMLKKYFLNRYKHIFRAMPYSFLTYRYFSCQGNSAKFRIETMVCFTDLCTQMIQYFGNDIKHVWMSQVNFSTVQYQSAQDYTIFPKAPRKHQGLCLICSQQTWYSLF